MRIRLSFKKIRVDFRRRYGKTEKKGENSSQIHEIKIGIGGARFRFLVLDLRYWRLVWMNRE